jgi:hypothetical protein
MAQEIQGKVGYQGTPADGNLADLRLARELALVVGDGQGRYYEKSSRGQSFIASTAAAGIAHGSALTATGALMLANPLGSGKNLSINRLVFGAVSGTLGVGQLWWCVGANPAALPAETTAATRQCCLLNNTNSGDIAKAYSGVSLTTVPVVVRPSPIGYEGVVVATAETSFVPPQIEEVSGELVVPPGFFVAVEGLGTAGTSPLVVLAISYDVISP